MANRQDEPRPGDGEGDVMATKTRQPVGGSGAAWPVEGGRIVEIAGVGVPLRGAAPPRIATGAADVSLSQGGDAGFA
jgi:hypothetical protein